MKYSWKHLRLFFSICAGLCLLSPLSQPAHAAPITGVYRLTTRGQTNLALDVVGYGNSDGTAVQLWNATHTSNQQWLVEQQTDGTYKIYAFSGQNSMQMLDYASGSTTNGTAVKTYTDNNGNSQRWYFLDIGGGYYRIIPKNAGLNSAQTLDIAKGGNAVAGSTADIYTYTGGSNQVFKLDWSGPSKVLPNPKKGVGGRETKTPYMHASWVYNWGGGEPADMPTGVEFVPMVWGYYGGDSTGYAKSVLAQPGVTTILAFNEPDHTDQANLTVDYALQGYAGIANAGAPVGSPACADDNSSWMRDFMAGAASKRYRVDYVCVHCYIRDPQGFKNYITNIHNLYGKPLWITEFAPTDWSSGDTTVLTPEVMTFMKTVVPWLNSQSYVQRYAWYTGASPGPWVLGTAALVNSDGTLTDLGRLYARM